MARGGANGSTDDVLSVWREQTLRWLARSGALAASPVFAYFIYVFSSRAETSSMLVVGGVWAGLLVLVARGHRWSMRWRAHAFILLFLGLVGFLQLRAGPMGAVGTLNLAMVLLSYLMLGRRAAVGYGSAAFVVFVAAAVVLVEGLHTGIYQPRLEVGSPRDAYTWIAMGLVLSVVGTLGLVALSSLVGGLQRALSEQRELTGALEEENRRRADIIEELQQTRARLEHAQKLELVGQLAGGMVHDLNNTLTVILAESDLCSDREAAVGISAAATQAGQLTRQMLSFSRRDLVRARPLDLDTALKPLVRALRRLLPPSHHLHVKMGPVVDAVVRIDPVHLQQILFNLVVNARDAMPNGGDISLGVRAWGDEALIEVTDAGHGIEPDVLPRIFEPFVTTKSADHGTGLGLANVRDILTRVGGDIAVRSVVGEGSTFSIRLPLCDEPAEASGTGPHGLTRLTGLTVLVVESDVRVRASMTAVFAGAGVSVVEARSVSDAVRQLEQGETPDVVCADAIVRGGGAVAVLEWLSEHRPLVPLLLTSDYSTSQPLRDAVAAGRVRTLSKPFSGEDLLGAVGACLPVSRLVTS